MLNDEQHVPWSADLAQETISARAGLRGPLLPVLHALQETFGYVDPRAVPLVAKTLNLSRADVYGVLTFYPDLRSTPPGRVRVQVCRGEACQAVGGNALASQATSSLQVGFGQTTNDGSLTLDQVFCLGNCALGPNITVNGQLHGRVRAGTLDRLVSDGARGDLAPGNQIPGSLAPGNLAPGNLAPGNLAPGNLAPGNLAPGNLAPGNLAPGNLAPGGESA